MLNERAAANVAFAVTPNVAPSEITTRLLRLPRLPVPATDNVPALILTLPMKSLAAESTRVPAKVLLSAVVTPPLFRPVPPMVLA